MRTQAGTHTHKHVPPVIPRKKSSRPLFCFISRRSPMEQTTSRLRAKSQHARWGRRTHVQKNGGSRKAKKLTAPKSGPPPHHKNPLGASDSATLQGRYNYEKTQGPPAGRCEGRRPTPHRHPPLHPLPSGKQPKSHNILQSNPNQNQSPKSTQAQRSTPKESWQH